MKQRVITAIVLLLVAIPVCIFSGTVIFPMAMAFIGFMGVYEMLGCMGTRRNLLISIPLYALAIASPFTIWYKYNYYLLSSLRPDYSAILVPLISVLYLLGVWVFSYEKDPEVDMNKIITSAIVSLYIIGACSSIVMIREAVGGEFYWYFIFIGA